MRVLVVEVYPQIIEFIERVLNAKNHTVVKARTATEGLRLYRKHKNFDFVFCGLTPDGKTTGVQLLRKIHAENEDQAYGFMTGHPILSKPFKVAELLRFVESCGRESPAPKLT